MQVLIQFEKKPVFFSSPDSIISCYDPALLPAAFIQIEEALKKGYYLAGFLSYEAGYYFEEKLRQGSKFDFPLVYFGAYKKAGAKTCFAPGSYSLQKPRLNISRALYREHINAIREYIASGDVYQVTYCLKLLFDFSGSAFSFYQRLLKEQPVPYPAYIQTPDYSILSLSPELFIKKNGTHLVTKPMKGTWPCGKGVLEDWLAPLRLKYDRKNRAENVMIADLLRNDLGRLGSGVKAPELFQVARYKTLCQMTSTVTARIPKDIRIYDLFAGIFPSGSVTGAPKIRAMQIIKQLENQERKIYTGAIGYISPDKEMFFNIPIRTILIKNGAAEMGIGGGIVWDSTDQGEWDEGLFKAEFLTRQFKIKINPF